MSQAVGEIGLLAYATGARAGLPARGWVVLLRVGIVHLLFVLLLLAASVPGAIQLVEFLRTAPGIDWFVMAMLAQAVGVHVMMLGNGMAVAGYWHASHGRSPRRWFLLYVPIQLALMFLIWAVSITLAAASPHQLSPNTSVGTSYITALILPFVYVVLNLPLFLLLFPRIRRACFAG